MKKIAIFIAVMCVLAYFMKKKNNTVEVLTTNDGMKYVKLTPLTGDNSGNNNNSCGGAYQGYEVKDPGIQNMSAILIQIPNGWQAQNSFTRIWNGSTPINQVDIKAVSPDNSSSVEILPYSPYFYADGPTTRSLRETSRSMGMEQKLQPFELPPMDALAYIKQVVLPRLQQNGISLQVTNEQNLGEQNQFKGQPGSRHAYVDGRTQDGRNMRVECGIQLTASNMNGETYYNWSAFPAVMTGNNLEESYAVLKHIRGTVMYNPEWEQQCNKMNRKGNAANAEIAQKDFENVKAYRAAINNIHQGITNDRNNSIDQQNESFRDMIGGEAKFENPNTGERVRLDDKYKHYYSDAQGNYYASDEPIDFKAQGWSEVNRLDTKQY
ncbi:MAG: hypothetical protein U0U67_16940 [Chitinophagales bacterium]